MAAVPRPMRSSALVSEIVVPVTVGSLNIMTVLAKYTIGTTMPKRINSHRRGGGRHRGSRCVHRCAFLW